MKEEEIIPRFLLALVIGYIIAAITLHPEKKQNGEVIWYTYERFGVLLSYGVINGIALVAGTEVYFKIKKWLKK